MGGDGDRIERRADQRAADIDTGRKARRVDRCDEGEGRRPHHAARQILRAAIREGAGGHELLRLTLDDGRGGGCDRNAVEDCAGDGNRRTATDTIQLRGDRGGSYAGRRGTPFTAGAVRNRRNGAVAGRPVHQTREHLGGPIRKVARGSILRLRPIGNRSTSRRDRDGCHDRSRHIENGCSRHALGGRLDSRAAGVHPLRETRARNHCDSGVARRPICAARQILRAAIREGADSLVLLSRALGDDRVAGRNRDAAERGRCHQERRGAFDAAGRISRADGGQTGRYAGREAFAAAHIRNRRSSGVATFPTDDAADILGAAIGIGADRDKLLRRAVGNGEIGWRERNGHERGTRHRQDGRSGNSAGGRRDGATAGVGSSREPRARNRGDCGIAARPCDSPADVQGAAIRVGAGGNELLGGALSNSQALRGNVDRDEGGRCRRSGRGGGGGLGRRGRRGRRVGTGRGSCCRTGRRVGVGRGSCCRTGRRVGVGRGSCCRTGRGIRSRLCGGGNSTRPGARATWGSRSRQMAAPR